MEVTIAQLEKRSSGSTTSSIVNCYEKTHQNLKNIRRSNKVEKCKSLLQIDSKKNGVDNQLSEKPVQGTTETDGKTSSVLEIKFENKEELELIHKNEVLIPCIKLEVSGEDRARTVDLTDQVDGASIDSCKEEVRNRPVSFTPDLKPVQMLLLGSPEEKEAAANNGFPMASPVAQQTDEDKKSEKPKRFDCRWCGKTFFQLHYFTIHERTHTGDRPYACNVCGKSFAQSSYLVKHSVVHTGHKPYKCDICGNQYTQSGSLSKHKRTHAIVKPFACTVCGKGFSLSYYLATHERIHTGVKPHTCTVCGKQFRDSSNLSKHARTHMEDRPFLCNVCGKLFSQASHLTKHQRVHSDVKPFVCERCGRQFRRSHHLRKHKCSQKSTESLGC